MPREFPPWQTVYDHFRQWHRLGTLRRAHDLLRGRIRAREGRDEQPSAAVIDSQAAKTTGVGGPERGYDGRQAARRAHARVPLGRILVGTTGLVLADKVHGANLHDRDGGRHLPSAEAGETLPRLALIWANAGMRAVRPVGGSGARLANRGRLSTGSAGRRRCKGYERLPVVAEEMIYAAMSRIMLRRLARTTHDTAA
jgi:putative transposase